MHSKGIEDTLQIGKGSGADCNTRRNPITKYRIHNDQKKRAPDVTICCFFKQRLIRQASPATFPHRGRLWGCRLSFADGGTSRAKENKKENLPNGRFSFLLRLRHEPYLTPHDCSCKLSCPQAIHDPKGRFMQPQVTIHCAPHNPSVALCAACSLYTREPFLFV